MGVCGSHDPTPRHAPSDLTSASRPHTHGSNPPHRMSSSTVTTLMSPHSSSKPPHTAIKKDKQTSSQSQTTHNAQITKLMHEAAQFHRAQGGTSLHFTRLDLKNLIDIYLQLCGKSEEITKDMFTSQIRNLAEKSSRYASRRASTDDKPGEDQQDGMGHIEHVEDRTAVATSGPLKGVSLVDIDLIFDAFDYDHSGSINFKEMISGFSFICRGSEYEKFRFLFRIFDHDQNGELSRSEFFAMLKHVSASVLKMEQQFGNVITTNMSPLEAYVAMNGGRTKRAASFLGMPPPLAQNQQNQQHQQQQQQQQQHHHHEEKEQVDEHDDEPESCSIHIHRHDSRKQSISSTHSNSCNPSPKSSPSPRITTLPKPPQAQDHSCRRISSSLQSLIEEKDKTDHVDVANIVNADEDEILEQVTSAFEAADANCDGKISLEEFEHWVVGDAMARRFMESLRQSCTRICGISFQPPPSSACHRKRLSQDMDFGKNYYDDDDLEQQAPPTEQDLNDIDVTNL